MRVRLRDEARAALRRHARDAAPREACGVLIGTRLESTAEVVRVQRLENLAADPVGAFEIDGVVFARADAAARARGEAVVGIWHSHPRGPARPSATDLAAAWPGWAHVVVSAIDGRIAPYAQSH